MFAVNYYFSFYVIFRRAFFWFDVWWHYKREVLSTDSI